MMFVLGTAQIGMEYGIANRTRTPDLEMVVDIVRTAWEGGISYFDTAQAYGASEELLGNALRIVGINKKAKVITKISPNLEKATTTTLIESVRSSIDKLKVDGLFGLMLHRGSWLKDWESRYSPAFNEMKKEGLIKNTGVSVYEPVHVEQALDNPKIDMLQAPFNVFDQRAYKLGWFDKAKGLNKLFFVRSIYLQGLLLLSPEDIPYNMKFVTPALASYRKICQISNFNAKELALAFISSKIGNAYIVFGAEKKEQIKETLSLFNKVKKVAIPDNELFELAEQHLEI